MGSWDIKRYLNILLEKFLSACVTAIVIMGVDCGDENNQSKPVPGPHAELISTHSWHLYS